MKSCLTLVSGCLAYVLVGSLVAQPVPNEPVPKIRFENLRFIKSGWQEGQLALSADGKRVIQFSGGEYGPYSLIGVWDVETGKKQLTIDTKRDLRAVALSPDGKLIASGGRDRIIRDVKPDPTVTIWDAETGKPLRHLTGHLELVNSIQFSADGKRLLCGGAVPWYDNKPKPPTLWEIKVWDVANGKLLLDLKGGEDLIGFPKFSGDGKRIVATSDISVRVLDAETGKELLALKNEKFRGAVSRDGGRIVTGEGGERHPRKLWDVATGKVIHTLSQGGSVVFVTFSPDDKWVIGFDPSRLIIWDAATGKEILSQITGGTMYGIAMSADGKRFASLGSSGFSLWNLNVER